MAFTLRRNYENTSANFVFRRPPEAPVFEPSHEEFRNPLAYINKIRDVAEKAGICKIKPPPDWQPPFAIDIDSFTFVPRIQKLNEMEASTRIKINFLEELSKYWQYNGTAFKIPIIEGRVVNLYDLNKHVLKLGGVKKLDKDQKWLDVAKLLMFEGKSGIIHDLRKFYVTLVHPYEQFCKVWKNARKEPKKDDGDKKVDSKKIEEVKVAEPVIETITIDDDEDEDPSPKKLKIVEDDTKNNIEFKIDDNKLSSNDAMSRQLKKHPKGYVRRAGNCFIAANSVSDDVVNELVPVNKELARLAFHGAGPKLPGYDPQNKSYETKTRGKVAIYDFGDADKYLCTVCRHGDREKGREDKLLYCHNCEDGYHWKCLLPPLKSLPEGDWYCPKCISIEILKLQNFGFEQSHKTYNLQQFGAMADNFKEEYFQKPVYEVPTEVVEQEFWRIVSCIDAAVSVEYGADLHALDVGSGFPTFIEGDSMISEKEYVDSPWNLTNLPVCEGSILKYFKHNISGMKVPWLYVGMCFATFCWHNEDHWNYSINYLHWGEPKTWYGVPGSQATQLEDTMKALAPELFDSQPDLLQQLVTLMNPNQLMDKNINVVRTDQQAGEFVITFPRAYHAGFNQGYNFAEAVNFAPAQWIPLGRECIEHYGRLCRACVFSHDELIMSVALTDMPLSADVANATYADLLAMSNLENMLRKQTEKWGIIEENSQEFFFENVDADDDRACCVCKTTLYLSGVTCECQLGYKSKHTCLKHFTQLCSCAPQKHIFRYRYTLFGIYEIVQNFKKKYIDR